MRCGDSGRVIAATHRDLATLSPGGAIQGRLLLPALQRLHRGPRPAPADQGRSTGTGPPDRAHGPPPDRPGQLHLCATVREVIDHRLGPEYTWPGNVRELAQCIRRVILKRDYERMCVLCSPQAT